MVRNCKTCGEEFTSSINNALYCSDKCRNVAKVKAAQKRRGQQTAGSKKCNYCGKWFVPVNKEKCCSPEHTEKYRNHTKKWNDSNKSNYELSKPSKNPEQQKRKYVSPISTREQEELNKKIHISISPKFDTGRSLSKEEIAAIADKIMPPELIPNRHYSFSGGAFMETRFEG